MIEGTTQPQLVDRKVIVRPGVGAAGRIVQRAQLTSHRVMVDTASLIFVQSGRKQIRWASGTCIAEAGDAIALAAGQCVDITNTPGPKGEYGALWLAWTDDAIEAFSTPRRGEQRLTGAALLRHPGAEFSAGYQAALRSLIDIDHVPALVAEHRSQEVLLWLGTQGVRFGVTRKPGLSTQIRRTMANDPAHDWSLAELARQVKSSSSSVRRHLGVEGQSFRELLLEVRMTHALSLLQNTDLPVLVIAAEVGYDSPSRFAERFRARFGFLPSRLRGHKRS